MVAFDPGRITRSASPGIAAPGRTRTRSTAGSASSGSRSSKLAMCGRITTAMRSFASGFARRCLVERERVLRRQQPRVGEERHQAERFPAGRRAILVIASANSAGSPRNLLTRKPRISAASPASITALVPTRLAITPPRSMSPISTTGTSAARANPILAMSFARRFTSEALPAPSTSTMSASRLEPGEAREHERHQLRLHLLIGGGLGGAVHAPLHHDLRAGLALRLEQHRIHVDARRRAGGARLQRLGAADLAAVGRHRGIVRHVLRLERPHREAAIGEGAREPGHDQRLADVGAGSLEHQGARRHV